VEAARVMVGPGGWSERGQFWLAKFGLVLVHLNSRATVAVLAAFAVLASAASADGTTSVVLDGDSEMVAAVERSACFSGSSGGVSRGSGGDPCASACSPIPRDPVSPSQPEWASGRTPGSPNAEIPPRCGILGA